ncbi:MAG TPA: hypothetical protein VKT49_08390 [Bryobacteraceae bacterium]|nr:hypothetical protein [Bryobacteraceae bacterium]
MRQWSRAAWGLALLLVSLPVASRLLLGAWGFPEAGELAALCFMAGLYLEVLGRRRWRTLRDDAEALERALALAAQGRTEEAIARLTRALRVSPRLWQAYQYRGQLRLRQPESWEAALSDFGEAIRIAPRESQLYALRSQAFVVLGDEESARRDSETARALDAGEAGD